ncbi:hypothetical protein SODG_002653 [Sodalis praecaptivus]
MSQLFSPIALGNLELENRIVIAPMCQYSADEGQRPRGIPCISGIWRCRAPRC